MTFQCWNIDVHFAKAFDMVNHMCGAYGLRCFSLTVITYPREDTLKLGDFFESSREKVRVISFGYLVETKYGARVDGTRSALATKTSLKKQYGTTQFLGGAKICNNI